MPSKLRLYSHQNQIMVSCVRVFVSALHKMISILGLYYDCTLVFYFLGWKRCLLLAVFLLVLLLASAAAAVAIAVPLNERSVIYHNVTTYLDDTVYFPIPNSGHVRSLTLSYTKNNDCKGEAVILPCSSLQPNFSPNVPESAVQGRTYMEWLYLVEGSTIYFTYEPDSNVTKQNHSLWIVMDYDLQFKVKNKPCGTFSDKGSKCFVLSGPSLLNVTINVTSYYFYVPVPNDRIYGSLHWTFDLYSYNFSEYSTQSGMTVYDVSGATETHISVNPTLDLRNFLHEPQQCLLLQRVTLHCARQSTNHVEVALSSTKDVTVIVGAVFGGLAVSVVIILVSSFLFIMLRGWRMRL